MNLSKLTFGQLYKLHHTSTLMRVTAAYHGALERLWFEDGNEIPFTVSAAKRMFPTTATAWERLISFLTGPELRAALRKSAGEAPVRVLPGIWSMLTVWSYRDVGGRDGAVSRALVTGYFCSRLGVPSRLAFLSDAAQVFVMTDEIGAEAIRFHPGIDWSELAEYCVATPAEPAQTFWWIQTQEFRGLVNPCLRPIRTPDEGAQRREILSTAGN
jgi:hypothetical protein